MGYISGLYGPTGSNNGVCQLSEVVVGTEGSCWGGPHVCPALLAHNCSFFIQSSFSKENIPKIIALSQGENPFYSEGLRHNSNNHTEDFIGSVETWALSVASALAFVLRQCL